MSWVCPVVGRRAEYRKKNFKILDLNELRRITVAIGGRVERQLLLGGSIIVSYYAA
jgi:hypothetical protein